MRAAKKIYLIIAKELSSVTSQTRTTGGIALVIVIIVKAVVAILSDNVAYSCIDAVVGMKMSVVYVRLPSDAVYIVVCDIFVVTEPQQQQQEEEGG